MTAARQGYAARNDSEQVLKIDPDYADAKMAIGIQQFAVASLPRWVRMLVGIVGVGGNKERGLALLRESAAHGVITSVESRTVMSLFLRHDGRYPEALVVQHGLAVQFPHDYLYPPGRGQPDQGRGQRAGRDCAVQGGAGRRGQAGLLYRSAAADGVVRAGRHAARAERHRRRGARTT